MYSFILAKFFIKTEQNTVLKMHTHKIKNKKVI